MSVRPNVSGHTWQSRCLGRGRYLWECRNRRSWHLPRSSEVQTSELNNTTTHIYTRCKLILTVSNNVSYRIFRNVEHWHWALLKTSKHYNMKKNSLLLHVIKFWVLFNMYLSVTCNDSNLHPPLDNSFECDQITW